MLNAGQKKRLVNIANKRFNLPIIGERTEGKLIADQVNELDKMLDGFVESLIDTALDKLEGSQDARN